MFLAALPLFLWSGYGHDAQHTALSTVGAQALNGIHWSTPLDMNPQLASGELLIHYGSPAVTAANTVLLPIKTGATGGFAIEAHSGASGALIYSLSTDYTLPPHNWTPPYGIVLSSPSNAPAIGRESRLRSPGRGAREPKIAERLYYPGAGGTVYYRDAVDSATGPAGQIAFYGNAVYAANSALFNNAVQISSPLTADSRGNIFFGFVVQGANPANLTSGIARISNDGSGTWVSAQALAGGDSTISQGALNCAPALSRDESTVYFAVSNGNDFGTGYLVALNSASLAPMSRVQLMDPRGGLATVSADSSASPMVGPDGDVYYGVLENTCCGSHNDRGWMLHFNSTLTQTKIPGSFGWDDTPSVVPANLVPSYSGGSSYLILVKYNNYANAGSGDGVNKLAVLDPNASQTDEYPGPDALPAAQVMREVLTVTGATPDPQHGFPNAVREWCINTAVIDPVSKSALVNSEDGVIYRWDLTTNTLTQRLRLTAGLGEAYTPTLIGQDGTVYAINDATLFAIGN